MLFRKKLEFSFITFHSSTSWNISAANFKHKVAKAKDLFKSFETLKAPENSFQ